MDAVQGILAADQLPFLLCHATDAAALLTGAGAARYESATPEVAFGPYPVSGDGPSAGVGELQVPILADGAVFGTIHLTGRSDGQPFSAEDEELALGIAAVAGSAVERLALRRDHRRERWESLRDEITAALLAGSGTDDVLTLAAQGVRSLVDADSAAVCLTRPSALRLDVRPPGVDGALATNCVLSALRDLDEASLAHILAGPASTVAGAGDGPLEAMIPGVDGPALFGPLLLDGRRIGGLVVGRQRGRQPFTDVDRGLVEGIASHVSLILDYGISHLESTQVAVAADQQRIARDLHDTAIQQLFAIGMSLQSAARAIAEPALLERVLQAVEDLDDTIADIRATVHELQHPPQEADELRGEVRRVVEAMARTYGLEHRLTFNGLLDVVVPDAVAVHVVATIREALSNVGRHARATTVEVDLEVGAVVVVKVADDGVGMGGHPGRRSGLRNLEDRAVSLGGSMWLGPSPQGGMGLLWRVPLVSHSRH